MPTNRTTTATIHRAAKPLKHELIAVLKEKYGVSEELDSLDRTSLIRVLATYDFLRNNLPAVATTAQD